MIKKDADKFLKALKKEYPFEGIKVTLELHPGTFVVLGHEVNGHIHGRADTQHAHIQVNAGQHKFMVGKAIAHEYRHLMQWVIPELVWLDRDKEWDAHIFGGHFVKKYFDIPVHG